MKYVVVTTKFVYSYDETKIIGVDVYDTYAEAKSHEKHIHIRGAYIVSEVFEDGYCAAEDDE